MIKNVLIGAFEDTANDTDAILKWCYPMPGKGRFREANFTFMFVSHVLRRLNGGVFPIRTCKSDAFAYFEAPVKIEPDRDTEDGRIDAIIANWKSSTFVAIESKGSYTSGGIDHQVQRLHDRDARHTLLHNFDWPQQRDRNHIDFWQVVISGYWGTLDCPKEGPDFWIKKFSNKSIHEQSHTQCKKLKKRSDMSPFGLLFYCALIGKDEWSERTV